MGKITIKNVSTANVILSIPEIAFRRELSPGREIGITEQEYNDIMFDPGVTTLVRDHYIQINGVEEDQQVEEIGQVFDKDVISKMLDKQDITAFAKFIPNAQPAEKDTIIKLAVEKGITNSAFTALINKYCGVDIIKAINTKHLAEE